MFKNYINRHKIDNILLSDGLGITKFNTYNGQHFTIFYDNNCQMLNLTILLKEFNFTYNDVICFIKTVYMAKAIDALSIKLNGVCFYRLTNSSETLWEDITEFKLKQSIKFNENKVIMNNLSKNILSGNIIKIISNNEDEIINGVWCCYNLLREVSNILKVIINLFQTTFMN